MRVSTIGLSRLLVALVVLIAIAAFVLGFLALRVASNASDSAHTTASAEAKQALDTANSVASSRKRTIEEACYEQNSRNHNATSTLEHEIHIGEVQVPAQKSQLEQTEQFTVLLINALVPVRDCTELVKRETTP